MTQDDKDWLIIWGVAAGLGWLTWPFALVPVAILLIVAGVAAILATVLQPFVWIACAVEEIRKDGRYTIAIFCVLSAIASVLDYYGAKR
jgi:hypothetical protein